MSFSFSHNQQIALALAPKLSGFLSFCGSSWIVMEVLTEPSKRTNVYHRLLCGMSIWDIVTSISMFASTWPISSQEAYVVWAAGTEQSCSVQGAALQAGIAAPIYNGCLAVYYLLVVKYSMSEEQLQSRKVEPLMHLLANSIGIGTAAVGLSLALYGNASLWCWIDNDHDYYRWALYYVPLWIVIVLITIIMVVVYHATKKRETNVIVEAANALSPASNTSERSFYSRGASNRQRPSFTRGNSLLLPEPMADAFRRASRNNSARNNSVRSSANSFDLAQVLEAIDGFASVKEQSIEANAFGTRAVFTQSLFYTLSFYAAFLFPTINRILESRGHTIFWAYYLHATFIPLQGFFNVLIYRHSFFHRLKQRNPHMTNWELLWWSCRWSFLGPPRVSRKSMPNIDEDTILENCLDSGILPTDTDDSAIRPPESPSMRGSLVLQSIADDMLSFDAVETGDDWYNRMELNMFAMYSEFPNALTEETVMMPTDFPNVLNRSSFS